MLQLHKHHEELKNVWGDIEEAIPIVIPQKAKQPENLKVMLLPFQQESLYWMQQQEQGIWHGGMLAVWYHFVIPNLVRVLISFFRMRWGEGLLINITAAVIIHYSAEWARLSRLYLYSSQIPKGQISSSRKFLDLLEHHEFSSLPY